MLKVVIDSNIWISALLVAQGKSRQLINQFDSGAFVVSYPAWLVDEIRKAASKPRLAMRISPDDLQNIIALIEQQGVLVEPGYVVPISRDPKDDVFSLKKTGWYRVRCHPVFGLFTSDGTSRLRAYPNNDRDSYRSD